MKYSTYSAYAFSLRRLIDLLYEHKEALLALILFLIMANLFTVYFVSNEHFLYYWDLSNYWAKLSYISDTFIKDPYGALRTIYYSVQYDDYNYLPAFLLMPFSFLLGNSRLAYIILILNILGFAAIISSVSLHRKVSGLVGPRLAISPPVSVGIILLLPNFWDPILNGLVDVGGILIINVILLLYLNNSFPRQTTRALVLIGFLIPMLILYRRWYAYWGLSFYIALLLETGIMISLIYRFKRENYARMLLNIFIPISISALFLFIVATPFAFKIAKTNYADIYSAYRWSNTLFQSFMVVINYFGLFYFSLFLLGAVYAINNRDIRAFSMLLLLQWLIIVLLFSRTQDFGSHHLYMLLPTMLLFSSLFISRLMIKSASLKLVVVCGVMVLFVLNFLAALSSKQLWYTKSYPGIFTSIRHPSLVRYDINEIDRMLSVLTGLLTDPNDRVYVLASSIILNSSILDSSYLSLNRHGEIARKVLSTRDVDKRDGFPQQLLTAKYVVVGDPIQYHLRPQDQRVVGIPAESVLTQRNIGTSFVKLPYEFNLDDGVRAYIYQRTRRFNDSDLDYLSELFKKFYPDREYLYKIDKKALETG